MAKLLLLVMDTSIKICEQILDGCYPSISRPTKKNQLLDFKLKLKEWTGEISLPSSYTSEAMVDVN